MLVLGFQKMEKYRKPPTESKEPIRYYSDNLMGWIFQLTTHEINEEQECREDKKKRR